MGNVASPEPEGGKMSRGKKRAVIVVAAVLAVILVLLVAGGVYALIFSSAGNKLTVGKIDLGRVPDGSYNGSYSFYHDEARVLLVVKDHRIERIDILKKPAARQGVVEEVAKKETEQQSLKVDTVTGSTVSQKVVLRAIQEALSGKRQ